MNEPYRTPADEPEPEWRELTSFEVEVTKLEKQAGVVCLGEAFEHALGTRDERAMKELRLGQRVRVILQVIA